MLFQVGTFGGRYNIGSVLERWGFIDVLLPFILVFTLVYAVARKLPLFKDDKKFGTVIALVIALLFVVPHITGRYRQWGFADPVDIINQSIPYLAVIIVAILLLLVMVGMVTGGSAFGSVLQGFGVLVSLIAVFVIFGRASGWLPYNWLWFLDDPDIQALIIILLVFGLIVYFVTSEDKPGGEFGQGIKSFLKFFTD